MKQRQAVTAVTVQRYSPALYSNTRSRFVPLPNGMSNSLVLWINTDLLRYCEQQQLTFTRARPYRKNDNCYVEQKNYSVVRQTVGYQRFDTAAELMVLKQLYATLRLYTNFFQPTMKPAALKRQLDKYRKQLFRLASKKKPLKLKRHLNQRGLQMKPHLSI